MDGSDDYFVDDIVFDEEALAVLESEEQKYLTQTVVSSRPPTKRQRTESGWNPGLGNRTVSQDEIEELPEISLRDDGSYKVTGPASSELATSHVDVKKSVARPSTLRYSTVVAQNVQLTSRNPSLSEVQPSRASSLSQRRPHIVQQPQVSNGKGRGSVFNTRASFLTPFPTFTGPTTEQSYLLQVQVDELRQQLDKVFISYDFFFFSPWKVDVNIGG